ncbi:MAG: hypothetical protein J5494_01980 [Candidatus Methanomethylophilaceae archaeon]|nr:hypothetical protein [Candidatus Methanomethylophilaceae archaeon]
MRKQLLAASCLLLSLAAMSCGSETPQTPSQSGSQNQQSDPSAESASVVYDIPEPELPALDLTGQNYAFFSKGDPATAVSTADGNFSERDFLVADSLIGEVVNDAVFNRNLMVEQKFGCKVKSIVLDSDPNLLVMGGDTSFDVIYTDAVLIGDTIASGAYLNICDFPYITPTAEYWSPFCVRDTVFRGRLYMMPCDICLIPLANTGCLYFNKRILSEYDLENPYDMVHSNTWTIDAFLNMIKQVSKDLNGDGIMDTEDLYGALVMAQFRMACFTQFYVGSGKTLTAEDPDLGRVISVDGEFAQTLIDMLTPVLEDKTVSLNWYDVERLAGSYEAYRAMFQEGHALFLQDSIGAMDTLRDMEDDFGIVPNPKYDTTQEAYYHRVQPHVSMLAIPATVTDYEKVGAVTEYMAWLSHYTVLPAYYEVTIKGKRTRDEDAVEMLDIIHDTIVFDFGDVYDTWIPNYFYDSYTAGSYARKMGSNLKTLNRRLTKYTKALDALDN